MKSGKLFIMYLFLSGAGVTAPATACAQHQISLTANLTDYLCLFTFNAGAAVPLNAKWSAEAFLRFNPWTYHKKAPARKQYQWRRLSVYAGSRYWPWHVNAGWFAGGGFLWERYNFGGIFSKKTYEGSLYGVRICAGYALMIGKQLNMEFGLGTAGGYTRYTAYTCPRCGTVMKKGNKFFIYPDSLLLQLVYIFQ